MHVMQVSLYTAHLEAVEMPISNSKGAGADADEEIKRAVPAKARIGSPLFGARLVQQYCWGIVVVTLHGLSHLLWHSISSAVQECSWCNTWEAVKSTGRRVLFTAGTMTAIWKWKGPHIAKNDIIVLASRAYDKCRDSSQSSGIMFQFGAHFVRCRW